MLAFADIEFYSLESEMLTLLKPDLRTVFLFEIYILAMIASLRYELYRIFDTRVL
jgi:hypothetical protein